MSLAAFYPNCDVYCPHCHEWSDPADWDDIDDETVVCPECDAENGPLDGPLYSRPAMAEHVTPTDDGSHE